MHLQYVGDRWFTVNGEQAEEIRLWDDDYVLSSVIFEPGETLPSAGTYRIEEHAEGHFEDEDMAGWKDWRDALEFASGIERKEWV